MVDDDVLLIRKILLGDDAAFSTLVEKYRKGVHAFVWRKIGDFHHAEEITQDAFIQVYRNLSTLKNPNQFAGWLYVIANRLCIKWKQKRKMTIQSLEGTSMSEIDASSYNKYLSEQRGREATARRLEIVNKLLKKLPESERTVITLYYLGEMTAKEIGKFLGVSINTIKSRLRRARVRLKEEETVIRENLSSVQFPTQITENIMKKISQLEPTAPSMSKPFVPIGISAVSAIIALLLMGVAGKHLLRFQKPYSLEATSGSTIEIVDTQLVLDSPAETAVRNQIGRSDVIGNNNGLEQQSDTALFAAAQADDRVKSDAKSEWTQAKGPEGGAIGTLFTTTRGDMYAGTLNGLYRFSVDEQAWKLINTIKGPSLPLFDDGWWWPVAESQSADILYLATDIAILESYDRGETWETLCKGTNINRITDVYAVHPVGLVITDGAPDMTIYLAYRNGVFRTDDVGKTWTPLLEGLEDTKIQTIAAIQDTVFAGTNKGLYRLNNNVWEQVLIDPENMEDKTLYISALVVAENNLYVAAKQVGKNRSTEIDIALDPLKTDLESAPFRLKHASWSIYHSNDMGNSWNVITPKLDAADNKDNYIRDHLSPLYRTVVVESPSIHLAASGEKVMVVVGKYHFYSINGGKTWIHLDNISNAAHVSGVVLLNDNTAYRSGLSGIHRTTDGGASWHNLDTGIINTFVHQLIFMNNTLYANIGPLMVVSSTDSGDSWTPVAGDAHKYESLVEYDGTLYAKNETDSALRIFRFSHDENRFIEIPDVPVIEEKQPPKPDKVVVETYTFGEEGKRLIDKQTNPDNFAGINAADKGLTLREHNIDVDFFLVSPFGSFAASGTAYYVEYKQKLLRWKPGTTEWYDTGQVDTGSIGTKIGNQEEFFDASDYKFKLAVSENTVYVGMRDGRLMQSFDEGDTWKHATADLPFHVESYKQIIFVGKTVYVTTDKGVARSINGTDWQAITDTQGELLVLDRFAVDKSIVYGLSGQKVYRLDDTAGTWRQVTPEITHSVSTFEVDGNTVYIGTQGKGVFRFTLDDSENSKK